MHALPHLSVIDWISLAIFFASWAGYAWYSEHSQLGANGLIRTAQRYRLERRLAQGGMAEVWLGTDLQLSRQVAVKLLKPEASRQTSTELYLVGKNFA